MCVYLLVSSATFIFLALSSGSTSAIREIYDIAKELHEIEHNRHYRTLAQYPTYRIFEDISEDLAICLLESHVFMLLDSSGNFIDLSGIDADFSYKKSSNLTPDFN